MRRSFRRRTITPFSISFFVLLSITAYLAWHWKWIPWKLTSDPAAEQVADTTDDTATDGEGSAYTDEFGTAAMSEDDLSENADEDIFTNQQEPEEISLSPEVERMRLAKRRNKEVLAEILADQSMHRPRGENVTADFETDESPPSGKYSRRSARDDDPFDNESRPFNARQVAFDDETESATEEENPPADEPVRTAKANGSKSSKLRSTNERLTEIDKLIDAGEVLSAHEMLSEWYDAEPDHQPDLQERIDQTAQMLFFSPQPHIEEPYVVQPGDQLRKVGKKYHVPWEFISRVNRIDPRKIRAGQKLKVFTGPFTAEVDISEYRLTLKWKGLYVKSYLVGVGTKGTTPLGEFVVKDKLIDPVYYGQEGEVIANDDPDNPLGERWIDIGDSYGIHGTIEPDSIGKAMSKGCIRMLNDDVEEVYDFLDIGSTVVIHP